MPLPYENATSGDKALAEIQRVLQRFGCQRFGVMTDWENPSSTLRREKRAILAPLFF
jgi:ubiquinone/menaquinone biosynthesis C-methylase UbiE